MLTFKKDHKSRLKDQIQKARKEHDSAKEKKEQNTWKKEFKQLQEKLRVFSSLGKFAENKELINSVSAKCSEKELKMLKNLVQKEELRFLVREFKKQLKKKQNEEASALLSDIHSRASEEEYQMYEELFQLGEKIGVLSEAGLYTKMLGKKIRNFVMRKKEWYQIPKKAAEIKESLLTKNINEVKATPKTVKDSFSRTEELLGKKTAEGIDIEELPEENVNEFENIFGVTSDDEKDILEAILDDKEKEDQEAEAKEKHGFEKLDGDKFELVDEDAEEEAVRYVNPFLPYLGVVHKLMVFSIGFLFLSGVFFFIQLDQENRVLGVLGQDNLFIQKENISEELFTLQRDLRSAEARLEKLSQGTLELPSRVALNEIQLQKIDWIGLREDLHKATLDAFPYNDILNYIQYNNFQGDTRKGTIAIAGTIVDPSGRVFLLLTKLINSINKHPSFSGAAIKTFSKNKNADEEIGGYTSSFSLTLTYHSEVPEDDEELITNTP